MNAGVAASSFQRFSKSIRTGADGREIVQDCNIIQREARHVYRRLASNRQWLGRAVKSWIGEGRIWTKALIHEMLDA
jgi:hypothetical protein